MPRASLPPIPWTQAHDAIVVSDQAQRIPAHETAARLGRTVPAVVQRRANLRALAAGVTDAPWTDADRELLRTLWAGGQSAAAIGLALRRTKGAVVGMAHRMGLPARPSPIQVARSPATRTTTLPTASAALPRRERGATGGIAVPPSAAGVRSPGAVPREPSAPAHAPAVLSCTPAEPRLSRHTCLWTDGQRGAWVPCEAHPRHGQSFCDAHAARAHARTPGVFVPALPHRARF